MQSSPSHLVLISASRCGDVTARFFLCNDRNLELRRFTFDWDRFLRLLQPSDVTTNGVLGHGPRVIQILSFGDKARKGGNRHGVTIMLIGFKKSSVFVYPICVVLQVSIIRPCGPTRRNVNQLVSEGWAPSAPPAA